MPAQADASPSPLALVGLAGEPFDIPGSTERVTTATLRVDDATGGRTLLVRFPAGWSRPVTGWYSAGEEMFVIDGRLEMSGTVVRAGEWAFFPAGFVRRDTRTPDGAIALARFDGPPRWHEGVPE